MKTRPKPGYNRDIRNHPEYEILLKQLPKTAYRPLIGIYDMKEVIKVINILPKIEFPINSAGELIDKLKESGKSIIYENVDVDPLRMVKYMPSYYFPIPDISNFIEKLGELISHNRNIGDIQSEIGNIRKEVYGLLHFPVKSAEELKIQLLTSKNQFTYRGKTLDLDMVIKHIPQDIFPIVSEEEFIIKVKNLLLSRPLIESH